MPGDARGSVPPRVGELHIVRERLLFGLAPAPVALIEAGSGYGKSVLAAQYGQTLGVATAYATLGAPDREPAVLIASLRRALAAARLSDLLEATGVAEPELWVDRLLDALGQASEPVLLVLDDAHHLQSPAAVALVLRLAQGLPRRHRLLIAARSFVRALEPLWGLPGVARLDSEALALTEAEAAELFDALGLPDVSAHAARVAREETHGWATALVLTAGALRLDPSGSERGHDPVASPLRAILDALAACDRDAAIQLGHLPLISPQLSDLVAGRERTFERIVAGGIPLTRAPSGWWELPGPVAAYLAAQAPVSPHTVEMGAGAYERHGDTVPALRLLLGAGMGRQAAQRLAALGVDRVDDLGLGVTEDLVGAMGQDAVVAYPRVLLHLARLAESAQRSDTRARALARASEVIDAGQDPVLARDLDAERARDLMWDERTRREAGALATLVTDRARPEETVARARALDVLGRLSSWFSDAGPVPEAEPLLLESARLARRLGQRTWTAQALVALGAGFYFALARFDRAMAVLDEALGELPARSRYRAMVQNFRAEVLIELGRNAEAEGAILDQRAIGEAYREPWMIAYACWQEAELASYLGDATRTVRAVTEARAHRDAWFAQPSGVEFLIQTADYLNRVGVEDLAAEQLAAAHRRGAAAGHLVRVHAAAMLARSGDAREAEAAIAEVLSELETEPQERWPLLLLRAYAGHRRSDPSAGRLAAIAFDYCRELGHPEGPFIRERPVAEALLGPARAAGSTAALALGGEELVGGWTLRVLGGFALERGGEQLELPAGRPARAVRALAAAGGRLHAEALIETLWPDTAPEIGRNRLRNLLSRVRGAAGDLVLRSGDVIALTCELDLTAFETRARAALESADERQAPVLARSALALFGGELLPDDRYEPWVEAPRERLRLLLLELLDLLAGAAEREGEIDEAARLLRRAIEVEPHDEARYLTLARLLVSQGRTGSALATIRQARAALRDCGLEASIALEPFGDTLG